MVRGLVGQLGQRGELDADPLLLGRARSALALREADALRARASIRNAEARLRALINDPRFEVEGVGELLPSDLPLARHEPLTLQQVIERAVVLQPEVQQVFLQHRAAVLREGQAQIEALPRLDLILEGNLGGRAAGRDEWDESVRDTRRNRDQPGGLVGMRLEVPLGRDDARARLDRRRLETRQVESQGRATLATLIAESEVTLNEYSVPHAELAARAFVLRSARADLAGETERWQQGMVGAGDGAANALQRLLGAQERQIEAEQRFAEAQVVFTLAFLALQRVQGTFTSLENLDVRRVEDAARGPSFIVRRDTPAATPANPGANR